MSLFSDVFDGPDSLFGRVFGSVDSWARKPIEGQEHRIRIVLGEHSFQDLKAGNELLFQARIKSEKLLVTIRKVGNGQNQAPKRG